MRSVNSIAISLGGIEKDLKLFLDARAEGTLFDAEEASEDYEARFQINEGCWYEYQLSSERFKLDDIGENIIQARKRDSSSGVLAPNIFVGTLTIPVLETATGKKRGTFQLEVQSVKSDYREDYRNMLALITEKCTDLLMQPESPASHYFDIDYENNSQTDYQRFAFVRSILGSEEFVESVLKVFNAPVTRWAESTELREIRSVRRLSSANLRSVTADSIRFPVPDQHPLAKMGLSSLPRKIQAKRKTDSVDTPENRFVKHVLQTFSDFCSDVARRAAKGHPRLRYEAVNMTTTLDGYLQHRIFAEVSAPDTLRLNSPVLQRKEGYREILRTWLMFDLAAKLIWKGGEDVYGAGKKDVATLYEYWLFFKLLELLEGIFKIKPKEISKLIAKTDDGLGLQIKQGRFTALAGIYHSETRDFEIKFSYNRTFSGRKNYPQAGSWTTTLRPDYTLSIWPDGISEAEAEKEELIVHIHFDAKYKVANLKDYMINSGPDGDKITVDQELDNEKTDNKKGVYKNADLLKMHAYRDAIRRTGGAYVLYPGDQTLNRKGFHEIIPGLGAFPIRPSKTDDGTQALKLFIEKVVEHFTDRTTQREKASFQKYRIYRQSPEDSRPLHEKLPEPYGANRGLLPDRTFVLIGFYNTADQYQWITKNGLYNFRMDSAKGSLVLDEETVSAKYLLLHTHGDRDSGRLLKILSKGPKVFSKQKLLDLGYPHDPSHENYLVIEVQSVSAPEFLNIRWDFHLLKNYQGNRSSGIPFTCSLAELMRCRVGNDLN